MSSQQPSKPQDAATAGQQKKGQKQMTKAERRELQEKQRAAKAANATAGGAGKAKENKPKEGQGSQGQPPSEKQRARSASSAGPSRSAQASSKPGKDDKDGGQGPKEQDRGVRIFAHFGMSKAPDYGKGDIHPAVIRLALQFSAFKITGSNARCIATLTAFKSVIQDYTTPQNTTLSRHLMTHLSKQITHLVSARPMAVTMGNAIRNLKLDISGSDIDLPEQDAKDLLCSRIDDYVRDKVIMADRVIQENVYSKIKDGDVILTYARSSVVEKVLLYAHSMDKRIKVILVDSRPMLEGKNLLSILSQAGIPCTYVLLPALASVISEASMVLLGAHSIHANGAVFSRSGSALVAMLAKQHTIPVLVCCETYKFSETIQLDGFTKNELAPSGKIFETFPSKGLSSPLALDIQPNLEILSPVYDLTPPSNITAVVTEVGIIPPNSISSVPLTLGGQTL